MKICYFGTFESDYSRNRVFIEGLKKAGLDVIVYNYPIKLGDVKAFRNLPRTFYPASWLEADISTQKVRGLLFKAFLIFRFFHAYFYLFFKLLFLPKVDGIIIGYPSHLDVIVFYPFIKLKGLPLFFNPLVSLYDTFVNDRKIFRANSIWSKSLYFIDNLAFKLSDIVFIDTDAHKNFIAELFNIGRKKICVVPVGAEREYFNDEAVEKKGEFQVFFGGKYIPLHGIETIIETARILKNEKIKFVLVGKGQEYDKIRKLTGSYGLKNVEFIDWMDKEELTRSMKESHIVLGIFKKGGKAERVIPNKVYEALAAGAVVISESSPAVLEWFKDREELFLVTPEDPRELAKKIVFIKDNYGQAMAVGLNGRIKVKSFATEERIGELIKKHMENYMRIKSHVS